MAWQLPPDQNAMGGVYGMQDMPLWMQSGMMQAPPPASPRPGDFAASMPMPRRVGIGESIANALLPRRDEQGIPQAPGVSDFINAAMWAMPGMRGPRAAMAAEKGTGRGGGLERLPEPMPMRRNRMSPEERAAGFDRLAKEMEADGLKNKSTFDPTTPDAWERAAAEIRAERAKRRGE